MFLFKQSDLKLSAYRIVGTVDGGHGALQTSLREEDVMLNFLLCLQTVRDIGRTRYQFDTAQDGNGTCR